MTLFCIAVCINCNFQLHFQDYATQDDLTGILSSLSMLTDFKSTATLVLDRLAESAEATAQMLDMVKADYASKGDLDDVKVWTDDICNKQQKLS